LTGGNLSGQGLATLLIEHAKQIHAFVRDHPDPFAATLSKSGSINTIALD
jgi:hypothetical protein